ncbi:hypothetical protein C8Q76DRAFT_76750 [Earliella scabrosa]|nr:hypothetical protein C8Q76DRAFT_76750 [Earliella scabrosa]
MSVKVMEEVKAREDEYDFVKDLASRIDGLCDAAPLARRARRLLWYGTLLQPDSTSSSSAPRTSVRMHNDTPVAEPRTPAAKANSLRRPAQRMSKLVTAVRDWDARRSRSGSISSFASSIVSVPTSDSLSSASSGSILVTPKSDHFPIVGSRGRSGSVSKGAFKAAADNARAHGHRQDIEREEPQGRMLNAMVFSDLIVLASPSDEDVSRSDSAGEQRCRLLPGSGLSRILDIYEGSGEHIIELIGLRAYSRCSTSRRRGHSQFGLNQSRSPRHRLHRRRHPRRLCHACASSPGRRRRRGGCTPGAVRRAAEVQTAYCALAVVPVSARRDDGGRRDRHAAVACGHSLLWSAPAEEPVHTDG